MRVIFFGASKFVLPIIEVLNKNFDLALVITTEKNSSDAVPAYCSQNHIKYISVSSSDITTNDELLTMNASLGVLAYFGILLKPEVLNLFSKGILNIHPSLLPKYRGTTPVQTAILNGDATTGVTLIKLDDKMDHGPIIDQIEGEIKPHDTAKTLYERLFNIGSSLLAKNIHSFLDGTINKTPQDEAQATFTKPLTRKSGYIHIDTLPSKEILDRMIRAYYPWPGTWAKLRIKNEELRIKLLPMQKLQVEGKKPVNYKDFLNGYPNQPFLKDFVNLLP